jgi:hypothetical protein
MDNRLPHPSIPRPSRFAWRAMTSVLIAASFLVMLFSGIILFVSPPGRVANWTNWDILGLRKHEWTGLHIWFSSLFLLTACAHLFFNWRPLLNYFKDRVTRRVGFRLEWLAALVICGGVFAGTRSAVPPFSSLLAFNERVKESWEKPRERAPIPHAELLTLVELGQKAGVAMPVATRRLESAGITNLSPEIVVRQLADQNRKSAQEIYQILIAEPSKIAASGGTEGGHRGGYGGGPGGGGGPGRKTLAEYCTDEGIELDGALTRLRAKGIKASAELTLREIAVNNGYSRPYVILDVINPATAVK